jgi:GNAT superfamily N-acetyltransferase
MAILDWYLKNTSYWHFKKAKSDVTLASFDQGKHDMAEIGYRSDARITPRQLADVFRASGINRPVDDPERMAAMLAHANLLVTAWDGARLIGVARGLTDFCYCCYLSDLAVDRAYQRSGIGRELVARVRAAISERSMLLLLAAPEAMTYYPKIGFDAVANGWIMKRAT